MGSSKRIWLNQCTHCNVASPSDEGNVFKFNESGGQPIRVLNHSNKPGLFSANFHPSGVAFGPDGTLFVSARGCPEPEAPESASSRCISAASAGAT